MVLYWSGCFAGYSIKFEMKAFKKPKISVEDHGAIKIKFWWNI